MEPMSLAAVASVVDGLLTDVPDPDARVTEPLVFDSRTARPGSLFLALSGEHTDGHAFAGAAVRAGAVAALTRRAVGAPAIVVDDVLAAAARLAGHLVRFCLPETTIVAITGSAGKTSTKDLIAQLLPAAGPTVATEQSFNNEIGLPVTVSRATTGTRFLVLEMGARHLGNIRDLTAVAPPAISVVTNVGTAHLGEFGGQDKIAQAKGEIVEALPPHGVAVLNADDPLVLGMRDRTSARIVTFGTTDNADIRAADITIDAQGQPRYTLITPEGSAPVHLRLAGEPQVFNSLAAAVVAREAGLGVDETAKMLSDATAQSRWRMETTVRADDVTIVNDAYNANPDSMLHALQTLASLGCAREDQRTIAVLGQMAELGADSRAAHEQVGRIAAAQGVDQLITIGGDEARWMQEAATAAGGITAVHLPDQVTALELLRNTLREGDVVLLKASRGVQLQQLAEALHQTTD
ncbi:UDP-N-acetylmuramoyl-tripeptide--D-alanyl-D-alanine ligase [Streptomyces katsurahamanus]|uniref:UDP-N-acetylmuramoyl-tripeptide--D-alanyl-D-alanine ligase n=1 Tax=Streptomyces katsurahamanus TaxID=2577098 RepID=A0ABW9NRI8_9ACTN|nr:UDP-N-acetylmuramoyl-tripeptide--D-alanyl-D-alanine ligase [Streptomyces katsurahamanus]MQS35928.1 UDP-N-acetylmuramoyl-tripeptide--D-alanyl-D-alanine ligase [Streptomyces katsurahamanus]